MRASDRDPTVSHGRTLSRAIWTFAGVGSVSMHSCRARGGVVHSARCLLEAE